MGDLKAREMPGHGAVLQRHDLVGNAGIDQRLGADDAARTATAVDDHHRARRRHQVLEAVDQLRTRDADGSRNGLGVILDKQAAIEDRDFVVTVDQCLELVGRDPGSAEVVRRRTTRRVSGVAAPCIDAMPNSQRRDQSDKMRQRTSYARHGSTRIFVCRLGFANSAKAPATSPMPTLPVTMGDTFTAPLAINSRALVNSAVVHANTYCSDSSLKQAYIGICRSASMHTPRAPIEVRPR